MLDQFYRRRKVLQRLRSGPLGPHMDDVAAQLLEMGFASHDSGQRQFRLLHKLNRWLEARGLGVAALDEKTIHEFLDQLQQGFWLRDAKAGWRLLLKQLRDRGIVPLPQGEMDETPCCRLQREFARYLVEQRGLAPKSVQLYLAQTQAFLNERFGPGPLALSELTARDVTQFVLRRCRPNGRGDFALAPALRNFFRFLRLRGDLAIDLAGAVPAAARWRLSGLPKSLPAQQVELVLAGCDRNSPMGRRDYAVLLVLARLGLRAGEIAAMRLEDLDWRAAELTVRGKGSRQDRLPILQDVGEALTAYLCDGRPRCSSRHVFVRARAPYREFGDASSVITIVERAIERVGLNPPVKGAHLLRHSLACEMLRRHASLGEIGQILRHRLPSATEIYAKVDLEALRTVAQPWPGARP
ncbi:MAG TPA: site-specific integrase [Thermoanaerobaculia bacterium]|nr:site-specific integrase [Thermoanaerobaculia bacterium]